MSYYGPGPFPSKNQTKIILLNRFIPFLFDCLDRVESLITGAAQSLSERLSRPHVKNAGSDINGVHVNDINGVHVQQIIFSAW